MSTKSTQNVIEFNAVEEKHICPVSRAKTFDNFLRPLVHNPRKLFGPYINQGMTVLDVGCGAGWASLGLARLVGEKGLVIAADLQPEMLEFVRERAEKAGLMDRVRLHQCRKHSINLVRELDFAVAFYMVHETPDARELFAEVFSLLKPGSRFFVAEPKFHVSKPEFETMLKIAQDVGFTIALRLRVLLSRAVVLEKKA